MGSMARQKKLIDLFTIVGQSGLTASEYFKQNDVFISLPQYYRLKKRFDEEGIEGLKDHRTKGNAKKVSPDQVELIRSVLTYNREFTSEDLRVELQEKWGIQLHKTRIDQYRREFNLTRVKGGGEQIESAQFAGIEVFSAIAHHIGILDHWYSVIRRRLEQIKNSESYQDRIGKGDHVNARKSDGKFTSRYNRLKQVRTTKFVSIDEKVKHKDFSRLTLHQVKPNTIHKKNLALLFLPLATNNGALRTIDKPIGNALKHACGCNYKNTTIDKYLRELKYLQISNDMIACNARFWEQFWKKEGFDFEKTACYYIDGNVKPLWSSKRCRKSKVTMLGRVMGCLEQVVIHDGYGNPIYFRTFSGNASLNRHALQSMEDLNAILNEGQPENRWGAMCSRILVMDGGGNAVATLRALAETDFYFITILDANQTDERKFKHFSPDKRYRHGEATLADCLVEMNDSNEPGYIYESRAVQVSWDNGRKCCLVTNIPKTLFDASDTVKAYFDRWPLCEKQYAMMKSSVNFCRIIGYGKKYVDDENMQKRIQDHENSIIKLREKLKIPLSQIDDKEKRLIELIQEERKLKENSTIKFGKRIQSKKNKIALNACQRHIKKVQREIKKIKEPFKKEFSLLWKKSKEFARIQGKDKVWHADVELDQLVTTFRLSLANIFAFFIKKILDDQPIEMNTLVQSILFLSGTIIQTSTKRIVCLNMNQKEPIFTEKLKNGFTILNQLNIRHPNGSIYHFDYA